MCEGTDSRCTTTVAVRGTRLAGASSRFLLPTFLCGRQRKVGAAPHRGNANRPIANQAKANAVGIQTNKRRAGKQIKERPTPQAYKQSAAQATKTSKPHCHRQTTHAAAKGKKIS